MNKNKIKFDNQKKLNSRQDLICFSLDQVAEEVYWITPGGRFVFTNKTAVEKLGYSEDELLQMYIWDIVPEYDKERHKERWDKLKRERHLQFESWHQTKDGDKYPVQVSNYYIKYEEEYEFSFVKDITKEKAMEREYKELIDGMNDTAWVIGFDTKFIEANNSAVELLGYSREKLLNMGPQDIDNHLTAEKILTLIKDMKKAKKQVFETVHVTKDGQEIPVEISSSLITYKGKPGILSIARDITKRKKDEEKIRYLSYHDNLTGLYNRDFFEEEIKRLDEDRQLPISLIFADLNGLKFINDTYGHTKGDMVIKKTAGILRTVCRKEDIIARWGGDEFMVILPRTSKDDARQVKDRVKKTSRKIEIRDEENIPLSVAVGVATKETPDQDIYEVLKDAEDKMYQNKLKGSQDKKNKILQSILDSLHKKCGETEEHLLRMQNLAINLGQKIKLSQSEMKRLKILATLHDIGKTVIPSEILNKQGKLDKKEWEEVKKHPATGYRIATSTKRYAHIADEVLSHHENWDGTGYPRGLKGEDIPLLARIISIVDAYDIMTHERPGSRAISGEKALEELRRNAGKKFDPDLVDIFLNSVVSMRNTPSGE